MGFRYAKPGAPVEGPLWGVLRTLKRPASIYELHCATLAHPNAIQHRLERWVRAGFVTRIEGRPKRFAMNDNAPRSTLPPHVSIDGRSRPRTRTARDRLWAAMRVLRDFDLPTLILSAGSTRRSAEELVNVLHRSGHLRQLRRGNPMRGEWSTYRLVRNTGPRSPSVVQSRVDGRRVREVVDGNTGERTDISPDVVSLRRSSDDAVADGGVG